MLFTKIGSSYSSAQFPKEFSNQLYFSENPELGEYTYKSSYSIKYVLSGREKYTVQGREFSIEPHQHLLVNNNSKVTSIPSFGKAISIFIAPETLTDVKSTNATHSLKLLDNYNSFENKPLILQEKTYEHENVQLKSVLKNIAGWLSDKTLVGEHEIDTSLFFQLSEALLYDQVQHSTRIGNLSSLKKSTIQEQYSRVLKGYHFLNDNWNKPFSLKNTAAVSMLSPYHFHRLFKSCFSVTPYEYHLKVQMEKVVELLKEKKHSISEITYLLGYSSPTAFGRAFKKYYGMPPSVWLK
jgi:AraC family transcriptional regulator